MEPKHSIVELLNEGQIGIRSTIPYTESVLISEVKDKQDGTFLAVLFTEVVFIMEGAL